MVKDHFFDTNVIIFYASFTKKTRSKLVKKSYNYISSKKGKILICYYVEKELENIKLKRKIIYREVLEKVRNKDYELGSSKRGGLLRKKNLAYAKKLYEINKTFPIENLSKMFLEENTNFEIKIDYFLKVKLSEKVIPISEVNNSLVNLIHEVIPNHADCRILASALQHQRDSKEFFFVTADEDDLNPNAYDYLKSYGELENYKFPILVNLLFEN